MANATITQQLKTLPASPGVYIYKDKNGRVLYVGKAKSLRSRVRSYWRAGANLDPAKEQMIRLVAALETIRVDTENEALVLEANLIRQHQPPYNVVLRDDKYYLFIKITKEEFPRVFPTRRIANDNARYFGPYSSARSVRATLRLLRRIFPHRQEKDSPHDIIFPHPLFSSSDEKSVRRSPADKAGAGKHFSGDYNLQPTPYNLNIQNIIRFLKGQRDDIIATLKAGMASASKQEHFEQAAHFRNQLQAIERLEGFQKVYLPRKESFDVVSLVQQKMEHLSAEPRTERSNQWRSSTGVQSAANVFQIRDGKLLNKLTFLLQHRATASKEDALRQFLLQYYSVAQDIPALIFIPTDLSDNLAISQWINKDNPPTLAVPERGVKRQLLTMGETNAQQLLDEQEAVFQSKERAGKTHEELMTALKLDTAHTHRVETYDISNIQGKLPTASMVVFVDGEPQPKHYRKFHIQGLETPNDFFMLQETLTRRFSGRHDDWPTPDLIIIDGGKGQLSSAVKILKQLNLTIPIISIAKQEEEIFVPGNPTSLQLPYDSAVLHLIQRMRDEAHRFTITYHRLLRSKQQKKSILDEIPGIGPKTKKALLAKFGSLKGIRAAKDADISQILGEAKTKTLRQYI